MLRPSLAALALLSSLAAARDPAEEINVPRRDARRIDLALHEATWASVDVSPDGRTLVFDLLGDLWSLPIEGGEAKALTSGPAWDVLPRFSPDGKKIAFSSDRSGMENLWIADADGKNPRAVTEEKDFYVYSADWTPDGEYLVARRETGERGGIPPVELWMWHVQGGAGIPIVTKDDRHNSSGPVASPDGRFIYYSARPERFSYTPDLTSGLWRVERYDRRTGETYRLTGGYGGAVRPALSPDGKLLVYVSRRDDGTVLVERSLDTGAERILARRVTRDEQEGFTKLDLWPGYAFTPDGKSLVYGHEGKIVRLDRETLRSVEIPFTARVRHAFAPRVARQDRVDQGPVRARILRWANETPADAQGRRRIAFDALGRVWIQELEAGKPAGPPRRLTRFDRELPAREYSPALAPDGTRIAWVSWSDTRAGNLWVARVPAAGEDPLGSEDVRRVTPVGGHYANPAWSPDGTRIAFIRGSGLEFRGRQPEEESTFEIRVVPAEGGEPQLVTTVPVPDTFRFHPQVFWSADGTRVYHRLPVEREKPDDDPKNDLVSVRLDGTDRKRHLRFPAIGDIVPSPDERWVAFTSRDNVYVAALPAIQTKEPPEVGLKEGAVPVWRLSGEAGGYVGWAEGGKTIVWTLGPSYHRLPLEEAIRFVEERRRRRDAEGKQEEGGGRKSGAKGGGKAKGKDDEDGGKLEVPKSQVIPIALEVPRAAPEGTVVLRRARVVTMKGDEVLENADVVVRGNRIAAIGPSGEVGLPEGATLLEARGTTVIPGLIDTHAHLHYSAFEIFPEAKWQYVVNLSYGVTTTYDPSAPSLDVFAQAEMVEAGLMTGPRVYSSGDVLYGGKHVDVFAEVNSLEDAERQVRRMQAYGARMIKVYQQPRREQRLWFVEACRKLRMLVTAEGAGELATDLTMAADGFTAFEHSLPVELHDDAVRFLAASGTHYTPTLLVSYGGPWGEQYFWQTRDPHDDRKLNLYTPHFEIDAKARRRAWIDPDEYHFPIVAAGAAEVARAGGNVSLGAHGQLQGLGVHWELWAMAGEGAPPLLQGKAMTPMEALRSATIEAADKIGFAPDLGSVEPGKLADLVVVEGDPLRDIHDTAKIRWVVKNGVVYDAMSMRTVHPFPGPPPRFFWKGAGE